VNCKYIAV